jgi:hypothetical protein
MQPGRRSRRGRQDRVFIDIDEKRDRDIGTGVPDPVKS